VRRESECAWTTSIGQDPRLCLLIYAPRRSGALHPTAHTLNPEPLLLHPLPQILTAEHSRLTTEYYTLETEHSVSTFNELAKNPKPYIAKLEQKNYGGVEHWGGGTQDWC